MKDFYIWVIGLLIFLIVAMGILLFLILKKWSITKRKLKEAESNLHRSKEQLVQSELLSSLGLFTAGIAHEINNPINHISGASQILFRMIDNKELTEKEIAFSKKSIKEGMEKVQDIITRLRNYSSTKSSRFITYNIVDCIEDALILLKPFYLGKTIIETDVQKGSEITCIPGKISQLMVNVIGNAIEACSKGDKISIKVQRNNDTMTVLVEDTGAGIAIENRDLVFDPFFTTKKEGLGLGLYTAQNIVKEHKGFMEIKSEMGVGTCVAIMLPLRNVNHNDQ